MAGSFYPVDLPKKRELAYMSRKLTSIEINGTFYRGQSRDSYAKWRDETPDGFVFALKGPRYATHRRVLAEAGESIERFVAGGVAELGDKLGPINWQFPPTKRFEADDFAAFLDLLPKSVEGRPLRHAVEVRHDSFRSPAFVALARDKGVAIVVAGDSEYPQIADPTAPFVYARIMGTTEKAPAGYSPAEARRLGQTRPSLGDGRRARGLAAADQAAGRVGRPRSVSLCHQRLQDAQSGGGDGADRAAAVSGAAPSTRDATQAGRAGAVEIRGRIVSFGAGAGEVEFGAWPMRSTCW